MTNYYKKYLKYKKKYLVIKKISGGAVPLLGKPPVTNFTAAHWDGFLNDFDTFIHSYQGNQLWTNGFLGSLNIRNFTQFISKFKGKALNGQALNQTQIITCAKTLFLTWIDGIFDMLLPALDDNLEKGSTISKTWLNNQRLPTINNYKNTLYSSLHSLLLSDDLSYTDEIKNFFPLATVDSAGLREALEAGGKAVSQCAVILVHSLKKKSDSVQATDKHKYDKAIKDIKDLGSLGAISTKQIMKILENNNISKVGYISNLKLLYNRKNNKPKWEEYPTNADGFRSAQTPQCEHIVDLASAVSIIALATVADFERLPDQVKDFIAYVYSYEVAVVNNIKSNIKFYIFDPTATDPLFVLNVTVIQAYVDDIWTNMSENNGKDSPDYAHFYTQQMVEKYNTNETTWKAAATDRIGKYMKPIIEYMNATLRIVKKDLHTTMQGTKEIMHLWSFYKLLSGLRPKDIIRIVFQGKLDDTAFTAWYDNQHYLPHPTGSDYGVGSLSGGSVKPERKDERKDKHKDNENRGRPKAVRASRPSGRGQSQSPPPHQNDSDSAPSWERDRSASPNRESQDWESQPSQSLSPYRESQDWESQPSPNRESPDWERQPSQSLSPNREMDWESQPSQSLSPNRESQDWESQPSPNREMELESQPTNQYEQIYQNNLTTSQTTIPPELNILFNDDLKQEFISHNVSMGTMPYYSLRHVYTIPTVAQPSIRVIEPRRWDENSTVQSDVMGNKLPNLNTTYKHSYLEPEPSVDIYSQEITQYRLRFIQEYIKDFFLKHEQDIDEHLTVSETPTSRRASTLSELTMGEFIKRMRHQDNKFNNFPLENEVEEKLTKDLAELGFDIETIDPSSNKIQTYGLHALFGTPTWDLSKIDWGFT